jgi:hypothetical protein
MMNRGHFGRQRKERLEKKNKNKSIYIYDGRVSVPDAVDEGRAEGAADRVGAREHHHLLHREVLGGEPVGEVLRRKRRRGEVVERLRLVGHAAVAPAGRDRVQEVAGEVDAVAGREGHDVRARHRTRAAPLHGRLGRVDHVEAAEARVVRRRLPLRPSAEGVHGQKDGGVTSLPEKIRVKMMTR